jgi:hypothetical protein
MMQACGVATKHREMSASSAFGGWNRHLQKTSPRANNNKDKDINVLVMMGMHPWRLSSKSTTWQYALWE